MRVAFAPQLYLVFPCETKIFLPFFPERLQEKALHSKYYILVESLGIQNKHVAKT